MDRSLITDLPRDKHVMRCKQRALAYLDRDDLKKRGRLVCQQILPPYERSLQPGLVGAGLIVPVAGLVGS